MERERILLIATSDIRYDQRLQKIAQALDEYGASVTLIGRKNKVVAPLLKQNYEQHRIYCIFNKGVLFYLEINIRFFFLLLTNSYTKVCANDADTLLAASLASYLKSFELYYDAHELFTEVPELEHKSLKKKVWKIIQQFGLRKVKKAYTVNNSIAQLLQKQFGKPFFVLRNVPKCSTLKRKEFTDEKFLLYQGALNKGRGLEALIQTMKHINVKLKIAGGGDIEHELKQLVSDLHLNDKVLFLGKLPPEELMTVTHQAYIGLNLLEDKSLNYYYSLANKFFDYAHAELPQISMDFPEYKALNEACEIAVLIPNLDVIEIRYVIETLLHNQNKYNELKENTKKFKSLHHWDNEKRILKRIYDI